MERRPAVERFANYMERELRKHDDRGKEGWKGADINFLYVRLREECDELWQAICTGKNIVYEAADVGNFAMMICEKATCTCSLRGSDGGPDRGCPVHGEASNAH